MTVPAASADAVVQDRSGRPVHVGDQVRVEGVDDFAQVATVDPRYGVVVVLVPGRAGKIGRMVRGCEVEVVGQMAVEPRQIGSGPAPSEPPRSLDPRAVESSALGTGFDQEIRLAVVMYGGISLAIYIHGVAQELLRLVRATSGADLDGDEVAKIYRKMSAEGRVQVPPGQDHSDQPQSQPVQRRPTRFVIDVLSGTSAGGINAVFLAKALAIRSKDLENLRQTWLDMADMDEILNNRRGSFGPKRSLLDGTWMYEKLYGAFSAMNDGPRDAEDGYTPVEQLDLFVTTTDLNGVSIPIRLADMDIPEEVHKGWFNFRRDNIRLAGGSGPHVRLDAELDGLCRSDFDQPFDAMLAFAARCTSSFPIAFAPMRLADIELVIGEETYAPCKERYRQFFRWIPPNPLIRPLKALPVDKRELADGGYLDNKPFDHAIDALTFRATRLPHTRKLFFIDPFPEIAGEKVDREHFDFVENAIAGSITLPHYQTIREEIDRVKASNRTQLRLRVLQHLMIRERPDTAKGDFVATTVRALIQRYGSVYGTYHAVRLFDCTDDLARALCGASASVQSEDLVLAVRYLVRAWREETYAPNPEDGKQLENKFFTDFDFSFRMRRAAHLLEWAQSKNRPDVCELMIRHLTRLHRRREQFALSNNSNPLWREIEKLSDVLTRDKKQWILWVLEPITDPERLARARDLYHDHADEFERVAERLAYCWAEVFDLNRRELDEARRAAGDPAKALNDEYQRFDYLDMVSLAFLEGSDVSEHTETEIYRISPADGIRRPLEQKLAGYKVQAFGAFLKREWRQNDILWGRLDACERIVSAVLNHQDDKELRERYVKCLQDAIVRQEARLRSTQDLAPALDAIREKRLPDYLKDQYVLPEGPPPKDDASRMARATDIFGRMIEEDLDRKNRMTVLLRNVGGIGAQLVGLLTPGSLLRVFWNYWLALLGLAGALLFWLASFAGQPGAKTFGAYCVEAAALIWVLSWTIGNMLARWKVLRRVFRAIKWLAVIAVAALLISGSLHVSQDVQSLWQRMRHVVGSR